jgi:hypothetical protein
MNKQIQKKDLSIRELSKILFNTLKDENKLAIKMIVRNYNNNKTNGEKNGTVQYMATDSTIKR